MSLIQGITKNCCCQVAQSCPTLCDPMDRSPPGFSVHGILQARILEWVAISSDTHTHTHAHTCTHTHTHTHTHSYTIEYYSVTPSQPEWKIGFQDQQEEA